MDDRMRRIGPDDLSTWKSIPAAPTAASSAAEATPAISDQCPTCKDAGYYLKDVRVGHPDFGRMITCHCKQEEHQRGYAQKLLKMSNLEPFAEKTFENFDATIPGVQRAYKRALEYARRPQGWLIFFGNYGCGKTHLAAAIANEVIRVNFQVLFAVVPDLLDHLRSTFGPNSETAYDERFEMIRSAKLLILDDLGTENTTPWAREKLFQLINHRYNYSLPTVITSNRKPDDIEPRIASRMFDVVLCSDIIMIEAGDYRRLSVQQRLAGLRRRY